MGLWCWIAAKAICLGKPETDKSKHSAACHMHHTSADSLKIGDKPGKTGNHSHASYGDGSLTKWKARH